MTYDEFLALIEEKGGPLPPPQLETFEQAIGYTLPADYRRFLLDCNGGGVRSNVVFVGEDEFGDREEVGIFTIGGIREEWHFSLRALRTALQGRIPESLLWTMDDGCGNAICIGLSDELRGRIYFWDHEEELSAEDWDGRMDTAPHISLLTNSFSEFVAGLTVIDDF